MSPKRRSPGAGQFLLRTRPAPVVAWSTARQDDHTRHGIGQEAKYIAEGKTESSKKKGRKPERNS